MEVQWAYSASPVLFNSSLVPALLTNWRQWRLPTVNELVSILLPPARARDLCLPPLFDPTQRWLWSADRRAYAAAYYVDVPLGFVGWQDVSAPFYVRGVSGPLAALPSEPE